MADSKRLKILKTLTALIETITPANGYDHDLTGSVFRGRLSFGNSDPVPVISVLEIPKANFSDESSGERRKKAHQDWELLIQGFVKDDKNNPTDPAHFLMADVKKAIGRIKKERDEYHNLGGEITEYLSDGGIARPADEISDKAHFYLRLVLRFVEDETDPYKINS